MEWKIFILFDPQSPKSKKGDFFEKLIGRVFASQRYMVKKRINFTGMEIDLLVRHKDRKEKAYIECKAKQTLESSEIKSFVFNVEYQKATSGYFLSTVPFEHQVGGLIEELGKDPRYDHLYFWGPEKVVELLMDGELISPLKVTSQKVFKAFLAYTYFGSFYIPLLENQNLEPAYFAVYQAESGELLEDQSILKKLQNSIDEIKNKTLWKDITPLQKKKRQKTNPSVSEVPPHQGKENLEIFPPVDFSAQICPEAEVSDLDLQSIQKMRKLLSKTLGKNEYLTLPQEGLLKQVELMKGEKLNYASLILLGKREALGRLLSNSELIFEYRKREEEIPYLDREDYRKGFLLYFDELWKKIDSRNEMTPVQDGFVINEIKNFDEEVIREAILNAVSHRDYSSGGSIFIKQYPHKILVDSPGGFPFGVTLENIFSIHMPRNRRIADLFQKLGFVERSGQGVDKMFRKNIMQGKGQPDYKTSDSYNVRLVIQAVVEDVKFVKFLKDVSKKMNIFLSLEDLIVLEEIRKGNKMASSKIAKFKDYGLVESTGYGKGTKYILSKQYYKFIKKPTSYTRERGFERETYKEWVMKHLAYYPKATIQDFEKLLPTLSKKKISNILQDLKKEGKIRFQGSRKKGFWTKT